jgi:serine/threonine protein kinase
MVPKIPEDPDPSGSPLSGSRESDGAGPASSATADSLLREVAAISEPTPSAVERAEGRAARGELAPGQVIAKRYRLDQELGRGGMGVVWAATHLVTRRRVAIKFLLGPADPRADLRRRFLREARAASAVDHPNVVEVLDVFELEDETPVIVMELLAGETLRDTLEREKKLPLEQAASILLPVAAAVGSAHALGIVHRDLKPENIFLVRGTRPGETVKVLDFGVAKLLASDGEGPETDAITGTGSVIGTPCYMAPEQTLGEKDIDVRADIWALGVILYECLAGVRPVQGSGIGQVVMKLATEGIAPLDQVVPGLPREATTLVMRMLARERAARPQGVREVQQVLARFASGASLPFATTAISPVQGPVVDTNGAQAVPSGQPRAKRRGLFVGIAAGGVLVAAFAGWRWGGPAPSQPGAASRVSEPASGLVAPPAAASQSPVPLAAVPDLPPVVREAPATAPVAAPRQAATAQSARDASAALPGPKSLPAASAAGKAPVPESPPLAPSGAPSATRKPAPGGLAEEAPF